MTVDVSLSFGMNIHLTDKDISQMPVQLRDNFLDWLPQHLRASDMEFSNLSSTQLPPVEVSPEQLELNLNPTLDEKGEHSHVKLTQLYDAGITKKGMPVRVRLKREVAKVLGRWYFDSLVVLAGGTIIYKGEKFDKPSPLATKINGSSVDGWEYVEVKIDGEWIRLEELRQIWRKTNG